MGEQAKRKRTRWARSLLPVALLFTGCLSEVLRGEAEFRPAAPGDEVVACLAAPAEVTPKVGVTEDLAQGSCWRRVGSIAQGDVYRPVGGVFMITSANAHEAYLVVEGGGVVGFYLPGESAFAPASEKTEIQLRPDGG